MYLYVYVCVLFLFYFIYLIIYVRDKHKTLHCIMEKKHCTAILHCYLFLFTLFWKQFILK